MLDVKEIIEAVNGTLVNGDENKIIENYEFDSRLVQSSTFFIPLKGEKTEGNNYIIECVKKGAIGFLIQNDSKNKEEIIKESLYINKEIIIITVEDTLKSFFLMGQKNREKHINVPIVAVTGSVGKTSTREMIASVLETKYNVLKTEKNYNSYLGIPYMLLKIDKQDVCVIEVGIDKIGEMHEVSKAVKPDVAVITNIGLSHIENFGNINNTYSEKIKICEYLKSNGTCLVNGDDSMLSEIQKDYKGKVSKYGVSKDDNYTIENIESKEDKIIFEIKNIKEHETIVINDIGIHNVLNAIAAIKVGQIFEIKNDQIIQGISNYRNFDRRMKRTNIKNNSVIINDAYNASYDSIMSGLKTIEKLKAKKKIIVIGDVLELGEYSKDVHTKLGKAINDYNIDVVITYGSESIYIYNEITNKKTNKYRVEVRDEILDIIDKEIIENTLIYVKSSNGMKLYETSEEIIKRYN